MDQLSHRYFQPKHGAWRGSYRFSISDLRALFSSRMQWFGRLSALSLSFLGKLQIETEVDASQLAQGSVKHTTRISKWGLTLYRSVEYFLFEEDGKKLRVRGHQRMMPLWWVARDYGESHGEIQDDGERASYVFPWFGVEMSQRSEPTAEGLLFTQEIPGGSARFLLQKYR